MEAIVKYGIIKEPLMKNPYVCIYDKNPELKVSNVLENYNIVGERELNENELSMLNSCEKRFRIYEYNNIFDLVKDDLRIGVETPQNVIEAIKDYEK